MHPIFLGATTFDAQASLVASSAGPDWENHLWDDRYLGWQVWNIQTGELVLQMGKKDENLPIRAFYSDIVLSPDGQWILTVGTSSDRDLREMKSLYLCGVWNHQGAGMYVDLGRRPEQDDWDVLAFDAQGEFFAAADESGQVAVFSFDPPHYPAYAHTIVEASGQHGARPLAVAFDSERHWLARIRGTTLQVWDLQAFRYPHQLEVSTGGQAGLTAGVVFDPSGQLLAVATVNGWQIWDVGEKKQLAGQTGVEVYAIAFSPDGRLFAWGDTAGVVHVWGIRE
jgi:WD40 repeat protein